MRQLISLKEIVKYISEIIDNPESRGRILDKASKALAVLMAVYPPAGMWNRDPGTRSDHRWYQRGFGPRWKTKGGSIGGSPYFQGIGGRETSQDMQKSWKIEKEGALSAIVFTEVTYAPYLFNPEQRVSWARGHGWLDLNEQEKEFAPIFENIALEEIDSQIAKI